MINTKYIEDRLKEYEGNKSIIETTLARVEVFKNAIDNPGSHDGLFLKPSKEIGMPRGSNVNVSPVEDTVLTQEEEVELLKEWIKEEYSRIYPLQIEKEQIDIALNALTVQQRFIIKCKYFENMMWRDIEYDFNDKFRQKNYITVEGLRIMNRGVLKTITKILEPYYKRFKI